jgi:hypothetical protein
MNCEQASKVQSPETQRSQAGKQGTKPGKSRGRERGRLGGPGQSNPIKVNQIEFGSGCAGSDGHWQAGFRRDAGNCGRDDRAPLFTVRGAGTAGVLRTIDPRRMGRLSITRKKRRRGTGRIKPNQTESKPIKPRKWVPGEWQFLLAPAGRSGVKSRPCRNTIPRNPR